MAFYVGFRRNSTSVRVPLEIAPERTGDFDTDVLIVCLLLDQGDAGEFILSGFGRRRWRLDVGYDMAAFVEHLPGLMEAMRGRADFDVDLYPPGTEALLTFSPSGEDVAIRCSSRVEWQPDPGVEVIGRSLLLEMLEVFAADLARALQAVSPAAVSWPPYQYWVRGRFETPRL